MEIEIKQPKEPFFGFIGTPTKINHYKNFFYTTPSWDRLRSIEDCIKSLELEELNVECLIIRSLICNERIYKISNQVVKENEQCLQKGRLILTC